MSVFPLPWGKSHWFQQGVIFVVPDRPTKLVSFLLMDINSCSVPCLKTFNKLPFLKWPPKVSSRAPAHKKRQSTRSMHIRKAWRPREVPAFQPPSSDYNTRNPEIWSASNPRLRAYALGRGGRRRSPEFHHVRIPIPRCTARQWFCCFVEIRTRITGYFGLRWCPIFWNSWVMDRGFLLKKIGRSLGVFIIQ